MSATATRLPLAEARVIAEDLMALLMPVCERLEVCGSIRRQAPTVGDIDIIAISRKEPMTDMFDQVIGGVDLLSAKLDELCGERVIQQARRADGAPMGWGARLKHAVYQGLKAQVQSVDPEVLGMWMVIRTGPHAYSQAFVTPRGQKAAIRRGAEVVAHRDGMLPPGFTVEKGFRLHRAHVFVPTPEEADVYRALGWRYPQPGERR